MLAYSSFQTTMNDFQIVLSCSFAQSNINFAHYIVFEFVISEIKLEPKKKLALQCRLINDLCCLEMFWSGLVLYQNF